MPRTSASSKLPPGFSLRSILWGHKGFISGLAWSPDEGMLASGSYDSSIRFWNTETGCGSSKFLGQTGGLCFSVAWSPDGRFLVSTASDWIIRLWDVKTGKLFAELKGHTGAVYSAAWSPDGRFLASGCRYGLIQLWDVESKKLFGLLGDFGEVVWEASRQPIHAREGKRFPRAIASPACVTSTWIALPRPAVACAIPRRAAGMAGVVTSYDLAMCVAKRPLPRRWPSTAQAGRGQGPGSVLGPARSGGSGAQGAPGRTSGACAF
jgi:hypothetical protein